MYQVFYFYFCFFSWKNRGFWRIHALSLSPQWTLGGSNHREIWKSRGNPTNGHAKYSKVRFCKMNGLVRVTARRHDVYRGSIQGSVYGSDRLLDSMKVERNRKGEMKGLLLWFWDDNVPATLERIMALEQTQLTLHLRHVKSRTRTA